MTAEMLELVPYHHVGAILSSFLVDGVATLGSLALIAYVLVQRARKLREARAAEATFDTSKSLVPGPAVLRGHVEYAEGAKNAVRVEVHQTGEETQYKDGWHHTWTEVKRVVKVEPFYLRLADGKRIRVEPLEDVLLVDAMDRIRRVDMKSRKRSARLSRGERVYACGQLMKAPDPEASMDGGYRSAPEALVLRPMPNERMLLSAEPLGARFLERAKFHARAAKFILAAAIFVHLGLVGFHIRRYLGTTEEAVIAKLSNTAVRSSDGDDANVHHVILVFPDEKVVVHRLDPELAGRLQEQTVVPVRRVREPFFKESKIGPGVTVDKFAWIVVPLLFIAFRVYRHYEQKSRPWYERPLVDEGRGALSESEPLVRA